VLKPRVFSRCRAAGHLIRTAGRLLGACARRGLSAGRLFRAAAGPSVLCIIGACLLCFILLSCATFRDYTGVFSDYPDLARTELFLKQLAGAYPRLAELHALGFTAQGRTVWALRVSGNAGGSEHIDTPRLLFTALTHSDEWVSLPAVLYTIYALVSGYEQNAEIRDILDNTALWFVPVVNPDGYAYSRDGERRWRKNRAPYGERATGVDINRNFNYMWNAEGGFSHDPGSRFYIGPRAASEPETRALQDLAARLNFKAAIDFHSFGRRILYPWGYTRAPCTRDRFFRGLAADMARYIKAAGGGLYTTLQMSRIYPAGLPAGTLMDYLYGTFGTVALTIELPPGSTEQGGVNPAPAELPAAGREALCAVCFLCLWFLSSENTRGD
jgi:carboxypeptidase T